MHGGFGLEDEARTMLDQINQKYPGIDDPRFKDYNIRRFTQLLKISLLSAASRFDKVIRKQDVERAHGFLSESEKWMPKALGSFGKSRNSNVANKILQTLHQTSRPLKSNELWRLVCDDLEKFQDLTDLLYKLQSSDRIQSVGKEGWLAKVKVTTEIKTNVQH